MIDEKRLKNAIYELILAIGENPNRVGLIETPERVVNMCKEFFASPPKNLVKYFETGSYDELVVIKNIEFYSVCEHHLLPFYGTANIAYLPQKNKLLGLSKIARIVDLCSKKLQLQERLTSEIADFLNNLSEKGVLVLTQAEHMCIAMRGVKKSGCKTVAMATRGKLKEDFAIQQQALKLILK